MTALSLVSINIERDNHLKLVIPFLRERAADIVCVQELLERDVPAFEDALGAPCLFAPSTLYPTADGLVAEGTGLFARLPVLRSSIVQYAGAEGELRAYDQDDAARKVETQKYALVAQTVRKDGAEFTIATTHFPWTRDGEADGAQRAAVERMLAEVRGLGAAVLCGDFNAPRGKEIFDRIAREMKDNIPAEYESSLDGALHRAGPLPFMVDGLFTTPGYEASGVSLVSGVSDHCAVVAGIRKASAAA
jgi:endonuclease/exonuclease/phosphatase family metal-dependent hydrolase